jgi:uncharacterized DUF497 family protein
MRYEWDDEKAARNKKKHGVSFAEAVGAFYDQNAIELIDQEHSSDVETRYIRIGLAAPGLLFVVFTEVGDDVVRIIHARRADKRHVRLYGRKE